MNFDKPLRKSFHVPYSCDRDWLSISPKSHGTRLSATSSVPLGHRYITFLGLWRSSKRASRVPDKGRSMQAADTNIRSSIIPCSSYLSSHLDTDMQVPGTHLQPNVLATARPSSSQPVSPRRNGGRVRESGRPYLPKLTPPASAPKAPALHPLVYAQQLGWSGLADTGNTPRPPAQAQGAFRQIHGPANAVSPPSFPPIPPLATTTPTYPLGNFPYYGGNWLGPQAPQMPQHATNPVIRQQDLAAYPTQFFHPQAAFQHQLLVPVFIPNQNQQAAPVAAPTTEYKDPFVYVQPPPAALDSERGRALFRHTPKTRVRVAQACEPCRKRKSKCTGVKPRCKRCDKKNLECVYIEDHRANRIRSVRNRMVANVPITELDEDYDGDSNLPLCPPAAPSGSSSSTYSSSSGYSSGSVFESADPPSSSMSPASEVPRLPYPIYVPPRVPPLARPSASQRSSRADNLAQGSSSIDPAVAVARALGLTDAQTAASTQPTATGPGFVSYQHHLLHPHQVPPCVPDVPNPGSEQAQHMRSPSRLPYTPGPQECIAGMSRPRSTPLTADTHQAQMCASHGLGQRLAAVAKETELPFLHAPPPMGRDRSSGSSSSSRPYGVRSGAQTPSDYFALPLPAGSQSQSSSGGEGTARTTLDPNLPPPMQQPMKSDGVASGLAQMELESMASGGVPLPGSLVSAAMLGQDWEGGYALEFEDWFHSFAGEGLPDSLPSGGDLSFYR